MLFDDLIERISQEIVDRKFSKIAMLTVWAKYNPRIFEQGIKSDGSAIGTYRSKSYKNLRKEKGLTTSYVNLEFSGMMRKNYQPQDAPVLGYYFSSQEEADKAARNENRYGIVFDLTEEEEELFISTLQKLLIP